MLVVGIWSLAQADIKEEKENHNRISSSSRRSFRRRKVEVVVFHVVFDGYECFDDLTQKKNENDSFQTKIGDSIELEQILCVCLNECIDVTTNYIQLF